MKVCIKNNEFNTNYHIVFGEEKAMRDGYTIFEVPQGYEDCNFEDFDNNGFNVELYNKRKKREITAKQNNKEINELKQELNNLTKDFIQVLCGAVIPDFEERKQEFKTKHNRLRELENKQPRKYN